MRRRECLLALGLAAPVAGLSRARAAPSAEPEDGAAILPRSTQWEMVSDDGRRRYRVMLAIPAGAPPPEGWPAIYVLDGNAFFATMAEAVRLESFMAGYQPAVVVGVGYDVDGPIDVVSRNYDYTPPTRPAPEYDDRNPTRLAGGADVFIDFLRRRLMPAVAARASVDPRQSFLFGHSYGGLFSAYCFLKDNGLFAAIAAASPSLWYRQGHVPQLAGAAVKGESLRNRLLLMVGENEQHPDAGEAAFMGAKRTEAMVALGQVDNVLGLARLLGEHGVDARSQVFAGETHASVPPAAISRAARFFLRRAPAKLEAHT